MQSAGQSADFPIKRIMKKAIILVNAYTQSQSELNQPNRIREELEARGVCAQICRNGFFAENFTREKADFVVYLDKDKYAARLLEKKTRLFNRAEAVELCDDKMLTHIALQGVPMPETLAGALCYTPSVPVRKDVLDEAERRLGYPMILKESFGSLGKGVYKADTREELETLAENLKCKPHLFQKFIVRSAGSDLRVIVIGGKAVGAMRRVSKDDFRSNAELGGIGESVPLDAQAAELAERVANILKLDYCGVDLLYGDRGYLLCEVNSNAFFGTFERVTGINVAALYTGYMIKEIYGE